MPTADALTSFFDSFKWLVPTIAALVIANRYGLGYHLIKAAVTRDPQLARSAIQAARVRRRWPRLAQNLKLALVDRTDLPAATGVGTAAKTATKPRVTVPRMRVKPDRFGVVCTAKTVPGVGLEEFQKASRHLANDWAAVRVAVTQTKPGRVRVRAVRVDPLAAPTEYAPDPLALPAPKTLRTILIGLDEYAEEVPLRLDGVSGIGIFGLPGYGKTSLMNNLITRLAPSPAVRFIGLDGKVDDPEQGDYGEVADRFSILAGDDLEKANELLGQLVEFGRTRSRSIRTVLGRKNVWHAEGPTADWPLIVVIIDEAHTFFEQVKDGGDKELRRRNALAAQNAMYVQELIKKRRAVGIITILLTQKGTGDAIPTFIRDVCAVSIAFACRTIEAAIAALGDDIRNYPDANPVALQDPVYIGVAVMAVQGRPGYTRVRMPFVPDLTAAAVATHHAQLVDERGKLPTVPAAAAITAADDFDDLDD